MSQNPEKKETQFQHQDDFSSRPGTQNEMVKQSNERNLVFPVLGLTSNFLTQKME